MRRIMGRIVRNAGAGLSVTAVLIVGNAAEQTGERVMAFLLILWLRQMFFIMCVQLLQIF